MLIRRFRPTLLIFCRSDCNIWAVGSSFPAPGAETHTWASDVQVMNTESVASEAESSLQRNLNCLLNGTKFKWKLCKIKTQIQISHDSAFTQYSSKCTLVIFLQLFTRSDSSCWTCRGRSEQKQLNQNTPELQATAQVTQVHVDMNIFELQAAAVKTLLCSVSIKTFRLTQTDSDWLTNRLPALFEQSQCESSLRLWPSVSKLTVCLRSIL